MDKLSPEQYAAIVEQEKPHLIEIENHVDGLQFGTLTIEVEVRAGKVMKMAFVEKKTWLRDKVVTS